MAPSESEFETTASATLETLFDAIEVALDDLAEVDLEGGILSVELDDGRQYILNKHAPNAQLWLSSPISGAHHFEYATDRKLWASTRSEDTLTALLESEFSKIKGSAVNLGPVNLG